MKDDKALIDDLLYRIKELETKINEKEKELHDLKNQNDRPLIYFNNCIRCLNEQDTPVLLVNLDTTKIINANNAACIFYGCTKDQLKKMSFHDFAIISKDYIHTQINLLFNNDKKSFKTKQKNLEGKIKEIEVSSRNVHFENKKYGLIMIKDITHESSTTSLLIKNEEKYRLLFNMGYDAVFLHGINKDLMPTNFIEVNDVACRRLGYTRKN